MKSPPYRRITALVLALALLLALPLSAAEEQTGWRTVRVACGINRALYLDEDGQPQGYCAIYLRALANICHWQLEYVESSMNGSLRNLADGKVDLVFPLQKTAKREETMNFSTLCGGYQPLCLFSSTANGMLYGDDAALNGARIAVTQNSSNAAVLAQYALEHGFSYTPVYMDSMREKTEAIKAGRADLIAASTVYDTENYRVVAVMSYVPFYYAVPKGEGDLLAQLNSGMEQLMIQQPSLAADVYLQFLNSGMQVARTSEENRWLHEDGRIVVGVYLDTPPLYHVQEGEEPHGIYVDLAKLLARKTGADIQLYPIPRDQYAYDLLEQGVIDVVLGSNDAPLRTLGDSHYLYSAPIMDYTTVTISRHNYASKASPTYILTSARRYWEPMILKNTPDAVIQYCQSAKDCLVAVQSGKADLTMLNAWEFNCQSKNARFGDLIEWENHRVMGDVVMAALSTANHTLLSVLDKGIAEVSTDEVNEMVTVNLNRPYDEYTLADNLYAYGGFLIVGAIVLALVIGFFMLYTLMRRKYTRQLEANYRELQRANQAKSEFLARMSHDIRTPLNVIMGMCRLAGDNANPPDTADCLEKISVSSGFLLGLVNDVLDMERIDSGKLQLNIEPYSGEEFSRYIAAVIQPLCDEKQIHFEYSYSGSNDFVILQDKLRINQIYFNLLSNAAKFTPAGGRITFYTQIARTPDTVTLDVTIADTGVGMSEDFQRHMFEPFSQESQSITPVGAGTGLGLSIVKRLCDRMDMKISVQSRLGEGTTFFVHGEYPVAPEQPKAADTASPLSALSGEEALRGKALLVCEDHPLNQEIIRRLLEKKGCAVTLAENGQQGLALFSRSAPGHYAAVLMDIRMPVMDGLEAARALRALSREDARTVPIIALSANAYEEDVHKCAQAGMNAHLAKPIEPEKLYETLEKYMCAAQGKENGEN